MPHNTFFFFFKKKDNLIKKILVLYKQCVCILKEDDEHIYFEQSHVKQPLKEYALW